MHCTIRPATADDLGVLLPLFLGYLDFYGRSPRASEAQEFLLQRLQRGESIVLLAQDAAGAALGFAQVYRSFSSLQLRPAWILNDLFVAPSARGQGGGRQLLAAVRERARQQGVASIALETALSNAPAQHLYESFGFVRDMDYWRYHLTV